MERGSYFLSNDANAAFDKTVQVYPGDTVLVEKAGIVYALGDVKNPGGYTMDDNRSQLTALQMIAQAGGLNKTVVPEHARLIRKNPDGSLNETWVQISRMQKGKDIDVPLEAGDIVLSPFSYVKGIGAGSCGDYCVGGLSSSRSHSPGMNPVGLGTSPLVSVVIPTRGRPQLVRRAIASAIGQTERKIEIVVVIDGPDPETESELDQIADSRLVRVSLEQSAGGAEARNAARRARGRWIALLDDDDEWLPNKLAEQLIAAESATGRKLWWYAVTLFGDPAVRRAPAKAAAGSRRADCGLHVRLSVRSPDVDVLLLAGALRRVPFEKELSSFQDIDWFLRATTTTGVALSVFPEPLSIYHVAEERSTITSRLSWESRLAWGRANRHRMTRRAYSRFIAGSCVAGSPRTKPAWPACGSCCVNAFSVVLPTPANIALILGVFPSASGSAAAHSGCILSFCIQGCLVKSVRRGNLRRGKLPRTR